MRRSTIGENPLDAVIPFGSPDTEKFQQQERKRSKGASAPSGDPPPRVDPPQAVQPTSDTPVNAQAAPRTSLSKERLTVHVPIDIANRAKNAVYWTPGLTLADLAAQALEASVDQLEADRGQPFPPRAANLKGGRPMK